LDKIIISIVYALYYVLDILQWVLFIRALLSWIPSLNGSKFSEFLYLLTEPFIEPVRKLLSRTRLAGSMIDFSFLITFILIIIIQDLLYVAFIIA